MVEVVFCLLQTQPAKKKTCAWFSGMTVNDALNQSGMIYELDPALHLCTGIFSKLVDLTSLVQPGDRIEVYRPLTRDPKETRRKRARES